MDGKHIQVSLIGEDQMTIMQVYGEAKYVLETARTVWTMEPEIRLKNLHLKRKS